MKYNIIEDCSPYYIRFTHDGLQEIIDYCNSNLPRFNLDSRTFIHYKFPKEQSEHLLSLIPMADQMPLRKHRVSLFITKPGRYYQAHKDGLFDRFSINYTVQINDDKCITSWYSDNECENYEIVAPLQNKSRECNGFLKENHTPEKSMIAKQNECILFNTEIFHDFDNRESKSTRIVLTLRIMEEESVSTYFEDAKKIIFRLDQ